MTDQLQIYAKTVFTEASGTLILANLYDIEVSDVLAQIPPTEILDTLDFSEVHDYVIARLAGIDD